MTVQVILTDHNSDDIIHKNKLAVRVKRTFDFLPFLSVYFKAAWEQIICELNQPFLFTVLKF